jgi:hypothetical protein
MTIRTVTFTASGNYRYHVEHEGDIFLFSSPTTLTEDELLEKINNIEKTKQEEIDMNLENKRAMLINALENAFGNESNQGYVYVDSIEADISATYQDTINMLALKTTLEAGGQDFVISKVGMIIAVDKDKVQDILNAYVNKGKELHMKLLTLKQQALSATTLEELDLISW